MRRLFVLVLILSLTIGLAAGCGPKPAPEPAKPGDSQPAPAPAPAPAKPVKDTLTFSSSADATTLDPQDMTDNTSGQIIQMMYNNLVKFDEKLNIIPGLAERWEVSDDELTWTFFIRKGVKFHNGKDCDAAAIKASFDRVRDTSLALKRTPLFTIITDVEVIDSHTVAFTTEAPVGPFLATLAHDSAGIVDAEYALEMGKDEYKRNPVGTGPYKLVSWETDQQLIVERFDDYWGEKGKLRQVIYKPIKEAAARVIALQTGETDVISHIPGTDMERLAADPNMQVVQIRSNGQRCFRFNHAKPLWDDPRVRQAVSYAIDRQAIVDHVMLGEGTVSVGPLSPVTWGAADLGAWPYDPDKAKQLLADAGFPNGISFKLLTTPRYAMGIEIAEAIQGQLKKVNIETELEIVEWSVFVANLDDLTPDQLTWDFFIMGAGPSTGDADWGLRPIFTTQPTNGNNYGFYSNEEFDDLIFRAQRSTDQEERRVLYKRAQEIVYSEDPGAVWIFDTPWTVVGNAKIKDIGMSPLGFVFFHSSYWEE